MPTHARCGRITRWQMEYAPAVMRKTSKRGLIDQIAAQAQSDQAIITITLGKGGKALLPVVGKINAKGDYVYASFPAVVGFYIKGKDGNLAQTTPGDDVEGLFFPEREAELKAKAAELATLKELARKHGFTLAATDGGTVKRTRAARGSGKPRTEPRPMPKKGDKFTSTQNGIKYTIDAVDGKTLTMTGEDGSKKTLTYSGIFWRWHTRA